MLSQNNAERLAKILGMCGSDHAGERAAAALAAHRLVADLNITWSQVIAAPPAGSGRFRQPLKSENNSPSDWQKMARHCWNRRDQLRPRDRDFVLSMLSWCGEPSERQQNLLIEIYSSLVRPARQ
jgi:hypothetical protein